MNISNRVNFQRTNKEMFLQGKRFGIVYVGRKLRNIEYENGRKVTYKVPLNEVGVVCPGEGYKNRVVFILMPS